MTPPDSYLAPTLIAESGSFLPFDANGVGTLLSAGTVLVATEPSLQLAKRRWMMLSGLRLIGGAV